MQLIYENGNLEFFLDGKTVYWTDDIDEFKEFLDALEKAVDKKEEELWQEEQENKKSLMEERIW